MSIIIYKIIIKKNGENPYYNRSPIDLGNRIFSTYFNNYYLENTITFRNENYDYTIKAGNDDFHNLSKKVKL